MQVLVECYSGYKAAERPLRFVLDDRKYEIIEVIDQWYGPHDQFFRVRADDGCDYILRHSLFGNQDTWTLEAFRGQR